MSWITSFAKSTGIITFAAITALSGGVDGYSNPEKYFPNIGNETAIVEKGTMPSQSDRWAGAFQGALQ